MQKLAALVVLKVPVADVEMHQLRGSTGSVRAVLVVRGDVEIATDLKAARIVSLDVERRRAVLVLAAPQARQPRLDHDRTYIWTIDWTGLWTVLPGRGKEKELINKAMEQAQQIVEQAGQRPSFTEQARQQAEMVLGGFFEALNWKVMVKWADRSLPVTATTQAVLGY